MKILTLSAKDPTPYGFTGIIKDENGTYWFKNGKAHREDGPAEELEDGYKEWWFNGERHRLDGPACEYTDGIKEWWIEGKIYGRLSLNDYVVLDHNKGKYGIMWYRLLDEDRVFEYPDIPGLIEK
jgi:hypothetical protein